MTDPNDPYAPPGPPPGPPPVGPAPGATQPVAQPGATQPLPVNPVNPASSETPFDASRRSALDRYVPPAPYQGAAPSPYQAPRPAPALGYPAPPQAVPYAQQYAYPYLVKRTNGLAVASLVLGILWMYWIGSLLALVFGYVALAQIRRAPADAPQDGRGLALAGVVLGWVGVAGFVAMTLFLVLLGASY